MPSFPLDTQLRTAARWLAAHPLALAGLVYAVLSLIFVGQGLLPGRTLSGSDLLWGTAPFRASAPPGIHPAGTNFELADSAVVFEPFFAHTRAVLPHIPLWNTHIMGGRPYLANAQSAVFSPFSLPMDLLPLTKAYAVAAALKLWIGALGAFALGRALGMRPRGAFVTGLAFAFGTFFVAWLPWPLTNIFPLIPWLLLSVDRLVRRPDARSAAVVAAVLGLQFLGGHPETSFHLLFATAIFFVLRQWRARAERGDGARDVARAAGLLGAAVLAGVALAAVVLIPVAELFAHSNDYALRGAQGPSHLEPRFLGAFFLADYWGRPTQTPLAAIVSNRGYYAGGVTLMLAAAALLLRPTVERIVLSVLAALAVAVAVGTQPLFRVLTSLPGFKAAHNGRLVVYALVVIALLAGWGVDELTARAALSRRRTRLVALVAVGLFCVPFAWMLAARTLHPSHLGAALRVAWGFAHPPLRPTPAVAATIRLSALLEWVVLAGLGLALVLLRLRAGRAGRWRLGPHAFAALVALLLVADLFRANMGYYPAVPIGHAHQHVTGAIRYLQRQGTERFAGFDRIQGQPLQADLALRYGLYDARGYDYPVDGRYNKLWRSGIGPPGDFRPPTTGALATARSLRGLDLLSVRSVIQDPSDARVRLPGLHVAYAGADARVYRNDRALPRAFLVGAQRVVGGGPAALRAVMAPGADLRRAAVTERAVPGLPTASSAPETGTGSAGTADLSAYGDEHAAVSVRARRPSLLVLTDLAYPGWQAKVDGHPTSIHRVDYLLRGVRVPAGTHRVEFSYRPASFRVGWIVSLVALVGVLAAGILGGRGRRPREASA